MDEKGKVKRIREVPLAIGWIYVQDAIPVLYTIGKHVHTLHEWGSMSNLTLSFAASGTLLSSRESLSTIACGTAH